MKQNAQNAVDASSIRFIRTDTGQLAVQYAEGPYGKQIQLSELDGSEADVIRGDVPETEKSPVAIYDSTFTQFSDTDKVPEVVLEEILERYSVVVGIERNWSQWNGRPEFSETYVDYENAEVLNE